MTAALEPTMHLGLAAMLLQAGHMLHFNGLEQAAVTNGVASRLLLAASLGGLIGLARAWRRKPSGVRTNLLICFGSAMFTALSPVLAGEMGNNKGQVAANVVQGIGFLGAGLILHTRDRVNGLTSAATVFVVASIGMACGAGLHELAVFATVIVLVSLEAIGLAEQRLNLKAYTLIYEVRASDQERAMVTLLASLDKMNRRLTGLVEDRIGTLQRLSFEMVETRSGHSRLMALLKDSRVFHAVMTFRSTEED